jgi:E3 ubiquitin-protein ligase DOA10
LSDEILEKCYSTRLRRRLLREETLTLDVILRIARALEASDRQAQQIEGTKNSESDAEKSFAYVIQPRSDTITSREFRSERPAAIAHSVKTRRQTIDFPSEFVIVVVVTVIEQNMLRAQPITKHAINVENVDIWSCL